MAVQNRTDSTQSGDLLAHHLSSKTSILGLKVYTIIGICVGLALLAVVSIFFCVYRKSRKRPMTKAKHASSLIPMISKDITEVKRRVPSAVEDPSENGKKDEAVVGFGVERVGVVDLESGKRSAESKVSGGSGTSSSAVSGSDASNLGWGRWYALTELEAATEGFNSENVIGEGGYGVVYRGVLPDNSVVAVKNLLNNK